MWLDCLILLPLILLGAERLAREGRWVMYTVTLGLCILTNYYISIMICIFLVLYFGMLLITEYYTMTEGQSQKVKTVFCRRSALSYGRILVIRISPLHWSPIFPCLICWQDTACA